MQLGRQTKHKRHEVESLFLNLSRDWPLGGGGGWGVYGKGHQMEEE